MKLYVLKSEMPGHFRYSEQAYTDRRMAELAVGDSEVYEIMEIDLPFIGKYVSYVHMYYGFSYGMGNIYDVERYGDICPSNEYAKRSPLWLKAMKYVSDKGEENHISGIDYQGRHFVASKYYNEPFIFGDCSLGCFNATIRRIKVVKETYEQHRNKWDKFLDKIYGR